MAEALVVLPTYNEIDNLESMVGRIRQSVPDADVLIVDDASPDGTGELADRLAADDAGVSVVHRTSKSGLGGAYLAGFDRAITAGYAIVCEIDADGSHDPGDLAAMVTMIGGGADLVIGSRWVAGGRVRNWPLLRRLISRGGSIYSRAILGSRIRDLTSGLRAIRTDLLRELDLASVSSDGYCFQVELAWRMETMGARVVEYPITFVERRLGRSKMGLGIVIEALARVTWWGIKRIAPRRRPDEERRREAS